MLNTIKSSIKQAIFSKYFLVGFIGVIVVIFISSISNVIEAFRAGESLMKGFHNEFINKAVVSEGMVLALPVIAALPFTASVVNDVKSGFIRYYVHRTSRRYYLIGKCMAGIISGGLVIVLGMVASYVIAFLMLVPREASASKEAEWVAFNIKFVKSVVLMFLSGAFWSMCGLTLATATNSKYMAYASPFIVYYVLIILYERYFNKWYILYPKKWINPSFAWSGALFLFGLIIGISVVFYYVAKRRVFKT